MGNLHRGADSLHKKKQGFWWRYNREELTPTEQADRALHTHNLSTNRNKSWRRYDKEQERRTKRAEVRCHKLEQKPARLNKQARNKHIAKCRSSKRLQGRWLRLEELSLACFFWLGQPHYHRQLHQLLPQLKEHQLATLAEACASALMAPPEWQPDREESIRVFPRLRDEGWSAALQVAAETYTERQVNAAKLLINIAQEGGPCHEHALLCYYLDGARTELRDDELWQAIHKLAEALCEEGAAIGMIRTLLFTGTEVDQRRAIELMSLLDDPTERRLAQSYIQQHTSAQGSAQQRKPVE